MAAIRSPSGEIEAMDCYPGPYIADLEAQLFASRLTPMKFPEDSQPMSKPPMPLCILGLLTLALAIAVVCQWWCECPSCANEIEFHHNDKVRVIGGFYTGKTGEIEDVRTDWPYPWYWVTRYKVDFDPNEYRSNDQWIDIGDLELITEFDPVELD